MLSDWGQGWNLQPRYAFDWELNLRFFDWLVDTLTIEQHQPGIGCILLREMFNCVLLRKSVFNISYLRID